MLYLVALFLLPPMLIFSLYHLALWCDLAGVRRMVFWRRVGTASAMAHVLFAGAFFALSYLDYRVNGGLIAEGLDFDAFLFARSEFWPVMLVFDTLPALVIVGLFAALDLLGWGVGPIVPLTVALVLALGTFQWFWIGGAAGALLERLWSGLKTQDDDGPDWL